MISLLTMIVIAIVSRGFHCDVDFQLSAYDVPLCLDQPVVLNCTVIGLALTWKIFYSNGTQSGSDLTYVSTSLNKGPTRIGDERLFTVYQLSEVPIVSNISFSAQSAINEFMLVCEDSKEGLNKTVNVEVDDYPRLVNIRSDTFTKSSVNISWTGSPSYCGATYTYNVSSSNITNEFPATENSTVIRDLVPSDDQHCVIVTAIEYYSTRRYKQTCFLFNVPSPVENVTADSADHQLAVSWNPSTSKLENSVVRPDLHGYYVTLTYTADPDQFTVDSGLLLIDETSYVFNNVPCGGEYNITVVAINGVGNSPPRYYTIVILPTLSSSSSSSMLLTTYSPSTNSLIISPSMTPTIGHPTENLTVGVIVGIALGVSLPTIIIVFIIIIAAGYFMLKKKSSANPKA